MTEMTNQEAIAILEEEKDYLYRGECRNSMAFDLAIKALKTMDFVEDMSNEISRLKAAQRPKAHWELHGMIWYCSNCGKDCEQGGNEFCGHCGADMKGAEDG